MTGFDRQPNPLRWADLIVSALLWIVHLAAAAATYLTAVLTVFVTDSCAYVACGDHDWIGVAFTTAVCGSLLLVGASAAMIVSRIRRRRHASPSP
jgi:Na+/H+ antiporter NhaD/arsenite permease-like protein